jgi:hypothetical protein
MERRGYLTLIRRNWHLLPYEQLLALLGWSEEKLAFTLREDDFLWIKLGERKPRAEPIRWREPSAAEQERAAAIRARVHEDFGPGWFAEEEPRFAFVERLSAPPPAGTARPPAGRLSPRYLHSYFALFGDPLLEPELDPYPDGYLARLAACGVDGIWLHGLLRSLADSDLFPEEAERAEKRLEALQALAARAARSGIGLYLYLNEPRAMPAPFFERHPGLRGTPERDVFALCTSTPDVRRFLREGVRHIFRKAPALKGVFTITMSENLTSCASHGNGAACGRCRERAGPEVVAEVNRLIAEGAREGKPDADVIVWDWGWPDGWIAPIVERLPAGVKLLSVSEWSLPIERGGIWSAVGEYSISAPGPGPRARRSWDLARARGLAAGAKVQLNVTWELSAVPYIPALDLVAEHVSRLRSSGVSFLMLGWTLGGHPSPNLEVASAFYGEDAPTAAEALRAAARRLHGEEAAPLILEAWSRLSRAFSEFPHDGNVVYRGPQQLGPANLLHAEPTGYPATMVGFPYDDLDGWRAIYPAETFARQLEEVARGWREGISTLEAALRVTPESLRADAARDLGVAEACGIHFESAANQARFVLARRALSGRSAPEEVLSALEEMRRRAEAEAALARRLFAIAARDSRIGYEASNHYYYLPRDLVEKVISCAHITGEWIPARAAR